MTSLPLRVVAATMLNPLIRELRLAAPDGAALPGFRAGAHVRVRVRLPDGTTDTRPYSLVEFSTDAAALAQPSAYRIAVRLEDPGRGGSRFMHQALQVGDGVEVEPPVNDFALGAHAGTAVLVAGGIGVTPLTAMAAALRAAGRPVRMVFAGRSRALMAYGAELQALLGDDLRLHVDDEAGHALDVAGLLAGCSDQDVLYVCGPGVMLEAVQREAAARGWPRERVRFEVFTTAAPEAGDPPFDVELALSGKRFTVPGDRTLLQALIDHGCDPMFDCQRGECGVCAVPVMSGDIDHRDYVLTQREKDAGNVIQACVSRARGTLVLDL